MSNVSSFATSETWEVLEQEVLPLLEKVARIEFRTIIGCCEIDEADVKEIAEQAEIIKKYLCSYMDGLVVLHCIQSIEFSQDESPSEYGQKISEPTIAETIEIHCAEAGDTAEERVGVYEKYDAQYAAQLRRLAGIGIEEGKEEP